jgi:glycosyltransferase involved in cell wall biosynthesis
MLRDWMRASCLTIGHWKHARRLRAPIVFLDQRWHQHGEHSGYLVSSGIGPALPRDDRILPFPVRSFLSRLLADRAWEARLMLHATLLAGRAKLLHVVDGDFDTWVYEKRPRWLKTRITATFHQTTDKLEGIAGTLRAGMLDGIVCVSRSQIPLLKHLVPDGRCVFIPHGVDTDFFSPRAAPATAGANPLLLAVGAHRRDFTTLMAAARIIKSRRPDARVRLIAPRDAAARAAQDGLIETASNVSDAELRDAYREARMLFLPLEAATANNALLESMATGCPAVITDLAAIRDYTHTDAALLCPQGDAQAHADAALRLLDDASLCARMGRAAHERVLDFSWPAVRRSIAAFLNDVVERSGGSRA